MKYLKKFEARTDIDIQKIDKKLINAVIENDLDDVKKYLNMGANPNMKKDHYTAPMWCIINFGIIPQYAEPEKKENWIETQKLILTELINSNPNLEVKSEGMTFWDLLNRDAYDFMLKNFPAQYQDHLINKKSREFNL